VRGERGETLAEVVVAVAIFAIASGALLAGTVAAAHRFGPDAANEALHDALAREMRIALDVMKYQGGSIAPATVATTIPMPGTSPAAVQMSIATTTLPSGGTQITLTATLSANPSETATLSTTASAPAPLPQSTILVSGSAPQ
jgi:hypothetical protein